MSKPKAEPPLHLVEPLIGKKVRWVCGTKRYGSIHRIPYTREGVLVGFIPAGTRPCDIPLIASIPLHRLCTSRDYEVYEKTVKYVRMVIEYTQPGRSDRLPRYYLPRLSSLVLTGVPND